MSISSAGHSVFKKLALVGADMLWLYASKSSSVLVGIFFLPLYHRLLGADDFAFAALLFSVQAFLLMVDFGMATLVGRDLAADSEDRRSRATLRAAQVAIGSVYVAALGIIFSGWTFFDSEIEIHRLAACVVFVWALTSQNIFQAALLARRRYRYAGVIQTVGILGRAGVTVAALVYLKADLDIFLICQSATAVVHLGMTWWACRSVLAGDQLGSHRESSLVSPWRMIQRGAPILLFGVSGAAVLQLDKLIVSYWGSAEQLTAYFLAGVICLAPISVMAGPTAQYFQPKIIAAISSSDHVVAGKHLKHLCLAILLTVTMPSALLWLLRDEVIHLWLRGAPNVAIVAEYVSILLPGVAVGAFGFIPYSILVAHQDFQTQAVLSSLMTVVTLGLTAAFMSKGSILAVCGVYAAYHSGSTLVTWLRAMQLQPAIPHNYATRVGTYCIAGVVLVASILLAIYFVTSLLV